MYFHMYGRLLWIWRLCNCTNVYFPLVRPVGECEYEKIYCGVIYQIPCSPLLFPTPRLLGPSSNSDYLLRYVACKAPYKRRILLWWKCFLTNTTDRRDYHIYWVSKIYLMINVISILYQFLFIGTWDTCVKFKLLFLNGTWSYIKYYKKIITNV